MRQLLLVPRQWLSQKVLDSVCFAVPRCWHKFSADDSPTAENIDVDCVLVLSESAAGSLVHFECEHHGAGYFSTALFQASSSTPSHS